MDSDDSDTAKAKAKAERKAARKAEKKRLAAAGEPVPEKKKKKKEKRKASEDDEAPKKKKKAKTEDSFYAGMETDSRPRTRSVDAQDKASKEALATAPEGSKALGDFSLSSVTRQALQARGVKVLFPIQAATFSTILSSTIWKNL